MTVSARINAILRVGVLGGAMIWGGWIPPLSGQRLEPRSFPQRGVESY